MNLRLARSSPLGTFRGRDTSLARRGGCLYLQANDQTQGIPVGAQNKVKKSPYLDLKKFSISLSCTKEREPSACSPMSRESMTVWDSRFQAVTDFRIPGTGFQSLSLELGFWILIVSGFVKLYSGLQSPGFRIFHKKKFPDFGSHRQKSVPHSEIRIPFHGLKLAWQGHKGEGILGRKKNSPSLSLLMPAM